MGLISPMLPRSMHRLLFITFIIGMICHSCIVEGRSAGKSFSVGLRLPALKNAFNTRTQKYSSDDNLSSSPLISGLVTLKGGKSTQPVPKRYNIKKIIEEQLLQVPLATRIHLVLALFCTIIHMFGAPAPALFALDPTRPLELWRPFTSMSYLGPPSMSMANSLYFLVKYGQRLESTHGTATQLWFLLVQTVILTALGALFRAPFQARALIAALVYTACNINPSDKMHFNFGLTISSWQLPFCMMGIECLSYQSIVAAWPHLMGIFSGHVFHFFTKVWPNISGQEYLATPRTFVDVFEKKNNFEYSDTSLLDSALKATKRSSNKIDRKKRGKGERLGSAT